ncbi:hypothetical protein [Chloroflexus sp. MS-G]|uniref:hypothetical protein n=1 Tax=Chloroflexus sp. MS-G TaxID=1521187 RepID=UPI0012691E8E|nr:hypothetical protein [Chloroflexus sp. MS-G]MBO9347712.1 hypothetical protein [Chloroflexus sp.]
MPTFGFGVGQRAIKYSITGQGSITIRYHAQEHVGSQRADPTQSFISREATEVIQTVAQTAVQQVRRAAMM